MKTYEITIVADTTVSATIRVPADSLYDAMGIAEDKFKRPNPTWEVSDDSPYDERLVNVDDEDGETLWEDGMEEPNDPNERPEMPEPEDVGKAQYHYDNDTK